MGQITEIRKFASLVAGEYVTIQRQRDCWEMGMSDPKPRLGLPPDVNEIDENDRIFRNDFIARCPLARGFSHVTLSILHEIGHHFNREAYIFSKFVEPDDYTTAQHIKIPYEIVATDWAIKWLQDPEHRKQAKAFERAYFQY